MIRITAFIFLLSISVFSLAQSDQATSAKSKLTDHIVTSDITNQDYRLWVLLPAEVADSEQRRHPVVYALDIRSSDLPLLNILYSGAQNNPELPKVILVAVGFSSDTEHMGLRSAQFTPSYNEAFDLNNIENIKKRLQTETNISAEMEANWRSGAANDFARVLTQELVPFVSQHYPVSDIKAVFGHSLAGLFLTNVLLNSPNAFDKYLISSPSLWWDNKIMLTKEGGFAKSHQDLPAEVFMSVGELESEDIILPFHEFVNALTQAHFPSLHLQSKVVPQTDHSSVIPKAYIEGMRYLFSEK
jgi:hypothetical protein